MNKMDKLKIKSQRKTCTVLQFHLCKHLKVVKLSMFLEAPMYVAKA